jgi:L-lactate dehydrogenase complex protein LldF
LKTNTFKTRSSGSLANKVLRQTYRFATSLSLEKRAAQVALIPEWEAVRNRAHAIKMEALENLERFLVSLEKQATRNGIQVHWATDGEETIACVLKIARKINAKTVVKSKSMTTEEIGLNHQLERQGLEVLETDLGEYIVQLAGEPPSHITAPALHKSRQEIGRLFAERLKIPYTDVPEELCAIARQLLREKFLAAELGISGVNFAAADTGTLVILPLWESKRLSPALRIFPLS